MGHLVSGEKCLFNSLKFRANSELKQTHQLNTYKIVQTPSILSHYYRTSKRSIDHAQIVFKKHKEELYVTATKCSFFINMKVLGAVLMELVQMLKLLKQNAHSQKIIFR